MAFYIISWKEFNNGKMLDKAEIVRELQVDIAQTKMREFNAQKRLTTTDYRSFDLSALMSAKGLEISEKVEMIPEKKEDDIDPEILAKLKGNTKKTK